MDRGGCKEVEGHLHTGAQVAHLQGKQRPSRGCLARVQELKSSDKNLKVAAMSWEELRCMIQRGLLMLLLAVRQAPQDKHPPGGGSQLE